MPHVLSERAAQAVMAMFPNARGKPDAPSWLVDQLVEAELHRRGVPDQVSGAFHALALRQGSLLKEEFDLSTHGHADGWVLGAVTVDPLEFMRFNMRHGFPAGDAALRAMVEGMQAACPGARVVRTHADGFAVLLGPSSGEVVTPALLARLRDELPARVARVTPDDGAPKEAARFTLGLLELTVVEPPTWELLGPLAWAELERVHVIARRGPPMTEVLRRRVSLDGRLPDFER